MCIVHFTCKLRWGSQTDTRMVKCYIFLITNHRSLLWICTLSTHCEILWHFHDSLWHSHPCCNYSRHAYITVNATSTLWTSVNILQKCSRWFNKQQNPHSRWYKTHNNLLNTGVAPNVKLAVNSFPQQLLNSLTFPASPDKWSNCMYHHVFAINPQLHFVNLIPINVQIPVILHLRSPVSVNSPSNSPSLLHSLLGNSPVWPILSTMHSSLPSGLPS